MLNNLIQGKPMIDQAYHVENGILRKYELIINKGSMQLYSQHIIPWLS